MGRLFPRVLTDKAKVRPLSDITFLQWSFGNSTDLYITFHASIEA